MSAFDKVERFPARVYYRSADDWVRPLPDGVKFVCDFEEAKAACDALAADLAKVTARMYALERLCNTEG